MNYLVIVLGLYMLSMGVVGYIRTKSPTALYINGGFALTTIILGVLTGGIETAMWKITLGWVSLNFLIMALMTIKRIKAHANARSGSKLIFGSMALFCLIVAIVMTFELLRIPTT